MPLINVALGVLLVAAPVPSIDGKFAGYAQALAKRGNGNGHDNGKANGGGVGTKGNANGKGAPTSSLAPTHTRGVVFNNGSPFSPVLLDAQAEIRDANADFARGLIDPATHDSIVAAAQARIDAETSVDEGTPAIFERH